MLQSNVKGFPIVSTDDRHVLFGYIGRGELRYVLDKARRTRGTSPNTPCSFYAEPTGHDREDASHLASGPSIGVDDEESTNVIETTASADALNLSPWVNQVRLQLWLISPRNVYAGWRRHPSQYHLSCLWRSSCSYSNGWGECRASYVSV